MKTKKEFIYNGQVFDSNEEIYFQMWLDEASKTGFIDFAKYQPECFELVPRKSIPMTIQLKTKSKVVERFFLHPLTYQADWSVIFTEKFKRTFPEYGLITFERATWIDVKGSFSFQDAYRRLSIYQKLVYDKFGIFVNMVIPEKFFAKTFCPAACYFMKNRKVLTVRKGFQKCKLLGEVK